MSKMSQPIRGQGGHLFSDRPEKHKLCRGRCYLASCQVSLNSVQLYQRRSRKCLSKSEARAAIFFLRSARKNTNFVEDVEILLLVKFRWILFSGFMEEVENVSANQRPGRPSCFSDRPEKHKLCRGRWDLASCQVSLNSVQPFQRRSQNVSANQRPGRPSCFSDRGPKNTNFVEDVEILLPVKFCNIPFSGFREEVENVKVNGGQTDDRHCVITKVHLSLRLRCTNIKSKTERPESYMISV